MKYLFAIPAILLGIALLGSFSTPPGSVWLGSGIVSPSDTAVYLSYLRQGAEGHILLTNLFAIEPHRLRFDLVWSTLGLLARTGIPIIAVHEIARALFSIVLILAISAAARQSFPLKKDADLATVLSFGGMGTGWLYSVFLHVTNGWTPNTIPAPDISSEFAISPTLFGGAHMILSVALLVTTLRYVWRGFWTGSLRDIVLGSLAGMILITFHPYTTPVLGLFLLASAFFCKQQKTVRRFFLASAILAPPVLYYGWLLLDPTFATHHLAANILPLASPLAWLTTLLPFIIAGIWMWRTKKRIALDWPIVWITCSVLLLVFLPVPWKRKLVEGLLIPVVFLTMPAWLAVRDWVYRIRPPSMRIPFGVILLLAAFLGPLHLVLSQLSQWNNPKNATYFYSSEHLDAVTTRIRETTDETDILLADDFWTNTWLPSQTGRRVWIGHDHETPKFAFKHAALIELQQTTSGTRALAILSDAGVTRFITTSNISRERFSPLIDSQWTPQISDGEVTVWKRSDHR